MGPGLGCVSANPLYACACCMARMRLIAHLLSLVQVYGKPTYAFLALALVFAVLEGLRSQAQRRTFALT